MKKKLLTSITIAFLSLFLSACSPVAGMFYGDYVLNVQNFGPNNEALGYYVHKRRRAGSPLPLGGGRNARFSDASPFQNVTLRQII